MAKVLVVMSGGVDSSVAAYLLKQQGYDVAGATMLTWRDPVSSAPSAVEDARRVADMLGIPLHVMDYRERFRRCVVDTFEQEYERGRTPNPCVICNRFVKWECLLAGAAEIGADYVATGHYARVMRLGNGRWTLGIAAGDEKTSKDQTYALCRLTQEQISRTLMPLGACTKHEVREIARSAGIPVADKPDSEENCFIPDGDYAGFIERDTGRESPGGNFISEDGRVLGRHRGIIRYTVGQRKHLGIALGQPAYVREIRPSSNEVVLSGNDSLFSRVLTAKGISLMAVPEITGKMSVIAKIRYNHRGAPAIIEQTGEDEITCVFREPQRAVTPGQTAVFYSDGYLIGGGTIT